MSRPLHTPAEDNTFDNPKHRPYRATVEALIGADLASQLAARFGRADAFARKNRKHRTR
jgi:hypothetical protein